MAGENERLDKAANAFKGLDERVKDLEERQTALENTFFAKRKELLKGYQLMAELHTFFIAEHQKFLDQLQNVITSTKA